MAFSSLRPDSRQERQQARSWNNGPAVEESREPRIELIEVCVFLLLIVPSLAISLFAVRTGTISFVLAATATIFRDLALVSLILYFLWRNREPVTRIGWTTTSLIRELLIGLALFPAVYFLSGLVEWMALHAGLSGPATKLPSFLNVQGPLEYLLAFVMVGVVAIAEETIFRGYLLLRLIRTTGSTLAAIVLSTLVFTIGHGYEGAAGLVTVGVLGFLLALIYLWRRSLAAPIVIHFLLDFLNIVLLPLVLH